MAKFVDITVHCRALIEETYTVELPDDFELSDATLHKALFEEGGVVFLRQEVVGEEEGRVIEGFVVVEAPERGGI